MTTKVATARLKIRILRDMDVVFSDTGMYIDIIYDLIFGSGIKSKVFFLIVVQHFLEHSGK